MKFGQILFSFCLLFSALARAEKLDIHTHDLVIEKLESALPALKGQASEGHVLVRLGDLYADRARLMAIEEEEAKCEKCVASKNNRDKAIGFYQRAFTKTKAEQQARVLLQIAHLHSFNGDMQDAKRVFQTIITSQKKYSSELVGESYAGLGELSYREGQFDQAKNQFESALKFKVSRTYFVRYRLAWCYLNGGNVKLAKSTLLSIIRDGGDLESSFRKDLTHDLATFIARGEVSQESASELLALSADADKKSNMFYLGQECDRLGNKLGSVLIWGMYVNIGSLEAKDALEINLRLAQNLWDQNKFTEANIQYEKFYSNFAKFKCSDVAFCDELRARSRAYIFTWIQKYKSNPTQDLLAALNTYVVHNAEDVEMANWAGHIARFLKNNLAAAKYYELTAERSSVLLENKKATNQDFLKKTLEGALVAEIECAEESQNVQQMKSAYNHYLKLNPAGEKADEVKYQITYLDYKEGNYKASAQRFHDLAVNENVLSSEMKIQAADLSLDALSILKAHEQIQTFALTYAKVFQQKHLEYYKLARQSALNQAVALYDSGKASTSEMKRALAVLSTASLVGASDDECIKIYKNRMLIAEKLKDLDVVDSIAEKILKIKNISQADADLAMERRLWVAEMRLDFKGAAQIAKAASLSNMSAEERSLKLAVLTELSGRPATSYYNDYLRIAKNTERSNIVRAKIVRDARNPWAALELQKQHLRRSPQIFAAVVFETFARAKNIKNLKIFLNEKALRNSDVIHTLTRFVKLETDKDFDQELSRHRLSAKSTTAIKSSLKERLKLLATADKMANKVMASGDFTLQIVALNRIARENKRLYSDLVRLPLPKGLTKAQRNEYVQLVAAQAAPYSAKAALAEQKAEAIWNTSSDYQELLRLADTDTNVSRRLVIDELAVLARFASGAKIKQINSAIAGRPETVKQKEIESAKRAIVSNPFDESKISKLKELEQIRGSATMVAYLEARLTAMKKGNL